MSEHIAALAKWALEWQKDVETLERALASDKARPEVRRHCAAALNYVVSRMDLVPDWEPAVGLFDDLMVLRICAVQALEAIGADDGDGGLDDATTADLGRLANQAEHVRDFLGDDLYDKLRAYCEGQTRVGVRGRTPDQLLTDEKARAQLYTEVNDAVARSAPVVIEDESHAAVRLKAYLGHKLK
ncbi:MAG TPA: YkvA family protein [Kofleriaceae bacterium]|nr:YkvA family protein [Kofleriaceae bacterium]